MSVRSFQSPVAAPLAIIFFLAIGPFHDERSPSFAHADDAIAADGENQTQKNPTRVLPGGKRPNDRRLGPLKDLGGYFPFDVPESKEAWRSRSMEIRRRLLVANGFWPMPTKTPLNAVVHGRVDRGDYTIEKVYFESYPGLFVTGNLYRPKNKPGRRPAILSPHGHFPKGRFNDEGLETVRKQIVEGAERFERGGRHPLQARCVQLARMGCVVFLYDMLGYADSTQLSFDLVHRFGERLRPEMESPEAWGFFSTQAELRGQSVMGVQTYNSIRALDFLAGLDDVDPERIAVTGASGGGTQTMILCAIDSRPAVSFPAVMVSTAMQGGCTCENACLLRVGTGNVEFAALFAPKPLGMTAADDWTREIAAKGLPELKRLYAMLGASDKVMARPLVQFPHNYNYVSRAVMYSWMNEHLNLGLDEPIVEEDYEPLSIEEMSVWDEKHPMPPGGPDFERRLVKWMTDDARKQLEALRPADAESLDEYRRVVGGAVDTIVGRKLPPASAIEREKIGNLDAGDYFQFTSLVRDKSHGEEIPVVFLHPKKWNGDVALWIDGRGKSTICAADGSPRPEASRLLAAGASIVAADLFHQGEFLENDPPKPAAGETRKVKNPRLFAGYTFGYNHPLVAQRAHDILTLTAFIQSDDHGPAKRIHLIATGGAAPYAAAALAQLPPKTFARAAIQTDGFRFADLRSWRDEEFLPAIVKYGDLPGLLSLAAPTKLLLLGERETPSIVSAAYQAAGEKNAVSAETIPENTSADRAVNWLLE